VRRSVYCTASFSICSLRRAKFPIIYPDLARLQSCNTSDETYIRVKGKLVYLYRAVDSTGATIDFLLSAKRDAAAERFLAKALSGDDVTNSD
jgi:transposase-like protein